MIHPDIFSNATYWTILALLCIGFATSSARAVTQDEIKEEFSIGEGGTLVVDVDDGDVEISAHDGDRVRVQVLRKAQADGAEAEREMLAAHEVSIERDGEQVRVWARLQEEYNQRNWNNFNHRLTVRFTVSVPRRFSADLKSSDGNISVRGLLGDLSARSSDGDFQLEGVRGEMDIKSSDGDLVLRACAGTLKAATSDGDIIVEDFSGPVSLQTSDGDVRVQGATHTVQAQSSDGDVDVRFAAAPDGDCRLKTSDGNVRAQVDKNWALSIDGKTGDGRIKSELPLVGDTNKRRLRGDINGGGPTLSLRTSDGNIALETR